MTCIPQHAGDPGLPAFPKTPVRSPAALTRTDRLRLERHWRGCDTAREPLLTHVLRHKIDAPALPDGGVPSDAVIGDSTVSYRIDGGPVRRGLLSHRPPPSAGGGSIPVSSLLGATLIGMRAGQRAPLLCDDGTIVTLEVTGVAQPA